ncbi:MAG: peptidoglycan-binding protein [Myxococcales bacterium]|nr:peptidoglycan-binding protein [Myxococcales bacterium]MCB9526175.1 peptidoglycan-binding protein [Myxococcales bacterium]
MSSSPVSFPVDLGGGLAPTDGNVALHYKKTEVEAVRGFFPLGRNVSWHGGVHLYADADTPIHSPLDGVVVAARIQSSAGDAVGPFGSHNFIVVKHRLSGADLNAVQASGPFGKHDKVEFFSVFMHLAPKKASSGADFHGFGWLAKDPGWALGGSVGAGGANKKADVELVQTLLVRAGFDPGPIDGLIGQKTINGIRAFQRTAFQHMQDGRIDVGGQTWGELLYRVTPDPAEDGFDDDLIAALGEGEIVYPGKRICGGQPLWFVGPESEAGDVHLTHWELISEKPLIGAFQPAEDDSPFQGDARAILQILDGKDWIPGRGYVAPEMVSAFYGDDPRSQVLRERICKFRSEWATDIPAMLDALQRRFWTEGLDAAVEPYQWYEAAAEQAGLPDAVHWHHNPIAVVERLRRLPELTPG